ncbi:MAG: M48 family metallopeptidase, partial [Candidatus Eremiobacterota bacterium]
MRWASVLMVLGLALPAAADDWTADERRRASDGVYRELVRTYGEPVQPAWEAPVSQIFHRMAGYSSRNDVPYTVRVVPSETINAYALPDGRVVFLTGLLDALPPGDEDAVAFVAGHEIAHIENHHAERFAWSGGLTGLALALLTRNQSGWVQLLAGVTNGLLVSGYSRGMEAEADRAGMEMMERAGYRPQGALATLKLFKDLDE